MNTRLSTTFSVLLCALALAGCATNHKPEDFKTTEKQAQANKPIDSITLKKITFVTSKPIEETQFSREANQKGLYKAIGSYAATYGEETTVMSYITPASPVVASYSFQREFPSSVHMNIKDKSIHDVNRGVVSVGDTVSVTPYYIYDNKIQLNFDYTSTNLVAVEAGKKDKKTLEIPLATVKSYSNSFRFYDNNGRVIATKITPPEKEGNLTRVDLVYVQVKN